MLMLMYQPVDGDEPYPDQGSEGGGEDRAALDHEGENRAHDDGDVAGQPRDIRDVGIDGLADHVGNSAWYL